MKTTIADYLIGVALCCAFAAYMIFAVSWLGIRQRAHTVSRQQWAIDAGRARWVVDEQTGEKNFEWSRERSKDG